MSDEFSNVSALRLQPSASYSFTMRLHMPQQGGAFARIARAIADAEAMLGAIHLWRRAVPSGRPGCDRRVRGFSTRRGRRAGRARARGYPRLSVLPPRFPDGQGRQDRGRRQTTDHHPRWPLDGLHPGVARVSTAVHEERAKAWALTIKSHMGRTSPTAPPSAVSAHGPEAAMPVMEGEAMLFEEFAGVDAFPLCIDTKNVDQIVAFVKAAAPTFGGINLEDIWAPRRFEIERRLRSELDIPVFHDDQHGTAIVVLAALLNALRVVGKRAEDISVVVVGAGAAGLACADILLAHGVGRRGRVQPPRRAIRRRGAPRRGPRGARGAHEQARAAGHGRRGAWSAPTCCSALSGPRRGVSGRGAADGSRRDRVRDGQPGARGPSRGGRRRRRDHRHRPL